MTKTAATAFLAPTMTKTAAAALLAAAIASASGLASAQQGVISVKMMTPEAALTAARAAMEHCRKLDFQVAVAVVDRSGLTQAFLRDRFAGAHTVDGANHKAWTAASFRISTAELASETQAGRPMSGIRALPGVFAAGGGLPIESGGSTVGAIGVSGASGGEADEACARAGIAAIADLLEL